MFTALITGANRGIGLALSRALAERGHFVYATARQPDEALALRELAGIHHEHLEPIRLDVADSGSVARALAWVLQRGRGLDLLVNNAGVLLEPVEADLASLDLDRWDRTFTVNVTGTVRVTQAFVPLLLKSRSPRIVNLSSGAGSVSCKADASYYSYGASKAALNHFTVGLAHELRPHGVTVAAVSPGWVRTDMGGPEAELSAEESAAALADTILNLEPSQTGRFLDRFGRQGHYVW